MDMDKHTGSEPRQHFEIFILDIITAPQHVAGVDEKDVFGAERGDQAAIDVLNFFGD